MSPRLVVPFSVAAVVWLTLVWVLLWGDGSVGTVLVGLAIALAVGLGFRLPRLPVGGGLHPRSLLYLLWRFVVDLVAASTQVVVLALTPGRVPRGAVIGVQLRSRNALYLTLTSEITCLVPGSVVVEAHRTTGMLYVHVLDLGISRGVEEARRHVLDTEARVLRAFASDAELAEVGLARDPRHTPAGREEVPR